MILLQNPWKIKGLIYSFYCNQRMLEVLDQKNIHVKCFKEIYLMVLKGCDNCMTTFGDQIWLQSEISKSLHGSSEEPMKKYLFSINLFIMSSCSL